jgi:hypothetical protein
LVKQIKVTEYKRLADRGEPLAPHLRGVIYEIDIIFEDFEAIEYAFGVTRARIHSKIVSEFVPLLIKLIDSELRKDSHRMSEKTAHLLKRAQPEFVSKRKKDEEDDDGQESIPSEDLNSSINLDNESLLSPAPKVASAQDAIKNRYSAHINRYLEDLKFGD